jgi:beta-N-acetylhexosaminidase
VTAPAARRSLAALAGAGLLGLAPVPGASAETASPSPTDAASGTPSATATEAVAPQRVDRDSGRRLRRLTPAERVLATLTPAQVVGQVFMVGTPAAAAGALVRAQIARYHVGNVMLTGRSHAGTRPPARVAASMQSAATRAATGGVRLLVSTDQEGGEVQVLGGAGLAPIPSGLAQGRLRPARLRAAAAGWGRALRRAGVNMNLGPSLDTVPGPGAATVNPPIGVFDRQYGYTPEVVAAHGTAFARGMSDAGVVATAKHFPGLGRVRANPDVSSGVTDPVTGRRDAYLTPFRTAIDAGVPVVMMSTAYYPRLDRANPAAFSRAVVDGLLRRRLGFDGVVVSDDLGNARQVARYSYGARALRFLRAGGDLVLTVDASTLPAMQRAVLARARTSPAFRDRVEQAALRVLQVKQRRGLLR